MPDNTPPPTVVNNELKNWYSEMLDDDTEIKILDALVLRLTSIGVLLQPHEVFRVESGAAVIELACHPTSMTIIVMMRDPYKHVAFTIQPRPKEAQMLNGVLATILKGVIK